MMKERKAKENKVKYVTKNGTFYIDYNNHGEITIEPVILDSFGLFKDIQKALSEFKLSKNLTEQRVKNIKTLLDE